MKKVLWIALLWTVCFSAQAKQKPNILFIISDDHA